MTAANQITMNALHSKVADVFLKVLQRYDDRITVIDSIDKDDITDEVLKELLDDAVMPSPAMMSAITKFLKDNEVLFDKGKVDDITAQQRALEERRKNRPNLANLTLVPAAVGE